MAPSSLLLSLCFYCQTGFIWCGMSLWPDVLAKLPPKTLLTASLVVCQRGSAGEMALMGALPSSSQNHCVFSTPFYLQIHCQGCYGENYLHSARATKTFHFSAFVFSTKHKIRVVWLGSVL